jgi:hypothetical protein
VPTLEIEITNHFSDVVNAAPQIQACVKAENQNLSAIVDNACKYEVSRPEVFVTIKMSIMIF